MKKIFFYKKTQFFNYKEEQIAKGYNLISISSMLSTDKIKALSVNQKYIIDISAMIGFIKKDDSQILNIEQLIDQFPQYILFICDIIYEKDIKYLLRHVFNDFEHLETNEDIDIIESEEQHIQKNKTIKKIIDLSDSELKDFFINFNSYLYGHEIFKQEFNTLITTFNVFNKLGEHKILSLFLMGDSGVGKTEVARAIHKALNSKKKLAKINFGNYSSHDALNSLIGSPLGYIGSDGGELVKRVKESDIGLILIDEFEKANTAVFNYFLDILENGKIINSQAQEYDINGYIIVFTSNINKEDFIDKISPELRSRFDYKGIFNLLTEIDKKKFVHYRVNQIIDKYNELISNNLPKTIHDDIVKIIDVKNYNNMRDLNKKIKDTFVYKLNSLKK